MEEQINEKLSSRRELLKKVGKTAAFVVPTLVTFQISNLAVAASKTRSHGGDEHRIPGQIINTI